MAEYVNWAPNEPNDNSGSLSEDCILKTYHPTKPGWHDAGCLASSSSDNGIGQWHALCQTTKELRS